MHQPYGASLYQLRSDMSVRSVKTKLFCKTKGNALTKLKKKKTNNSNRKCTKKQEHGWSRIGDPIDSDNQKVNTSRCRERFVSAGNKK